MSEENKIEKVDLVQYWQRWEHSGNYRTDLILVEIIKKIEETLNQIVEKVNKSV